jgi:hypothetical protein
MSKSFTTNLDFSWPKDLLVVIVILAILIQFNLAPADDPESKDLYESRKLQIEFLVQQTSPDSILLSDILMEADYFAQEGEYQIALDLLDAAIQNTELTVSNPDSVNLTFSDLIDPLKFDFDDERQSTSYWDISTEFGTDYSRNEYELSFLESDSLVLEELNNPYFSLRLARSRSYQNKWLNFYNHNRIDKDLIQTSFALALESIDYEQNWRIEGRTNWFWFLEQNQGTFWENEARLNWNKLLNSQNRFYVQTNLRSKIYFPDNETYHNLFDGDVHLALRHNYKVLHWLDISVRPSQYVEFSREGLVYSQVQSQIEYYNRTDYNQYFIARFKHYFRDFSSSTITEDYKNQYHSLRPAVDFEWPVIFPFGLSGQTDWDFRKYKTPDLTYSNFDYRRINLMMKFYFDVYNSIGIGYIHEQENHSAANDSEASSVDLEDFYSHGFSFSLDILQLRGLMISLGYSYVLRTYPSAGDQDILSIYSNRKIHNMQAFGYFPLFRQWQLQFFISYDNDRDRSRENNDNLSTLFNVSLQYHF